MIGTEKQLYKRFNSESGRSPHTLEALSPPTAGYGGYSLSPQQAGKTFFSIYAWDFLE